MTPKESQDGFRACACEGGSSNKKDANWVRTADGINGKQPLIEPGGTSYVFNSPTSVEQQCSGGSGHLVGDYYKKA